MNKVPLQVYRFLFTLRALARIEFADFPGIAIRGGLGLVLKRAVCVIGAERTLSCASCPLCSSCPYGAIFETPPPEGTPVMKKATHCPHPFSIAPLFSASSFERGQEMRIALSLYGDALKNFAPMAKAFNLLGESGLGKTRGKFVVKASQIWRTAHRSGRKAHWRRLRPWTLPGGKRRGGETDEGHVSYPLQAGPPAKAGYACRFRGDSKSIARRLSMLAPFLRKCGRGVLFAGGIFRERNKGNRTAFIQRNHALFNAPSPGDANGGVCRTGGMVGKT
jgi:hypothetical protein